MNNGPPLTEQNLQAIVFSPAPTTRAPSWTYGYESLLKEPTSKSKKSRRKERKNRRRKNR